MPLLGFQADSDQRLGCCRFHARQALQAQETVDLLEPLTEQAADFQNVQGINNSLGALYKLLAEGRISPPRASVLAYISSLLLRTLPAIRNDLNPHLGEETYDPAHLQSTTCPPSQHTPQSFMSST